MGALNGYVRLPVTHPDLLEAEAVELDGFFFAEVIGETSHVRGYDYITVPVHGGWTYGPDLQGWIGFDTGHYGDFWPMEFRQQVLKPNADELLEIWVSLPPEEKLREWTVEAIMDETSRAASKLAARARVALDSQS